MNDIFFIMEVNQSLNYLFHDEFALILLKFTNVIAQITIGAILKNDDQEFLLFVEKELTGLHNVWMV